MHLVRGRVENNEYIDRDLNAALNIERFGMSINSLRLVDREVPTHLVEASSNLEVNKC